MAANCIDFTFSFFAEININIASIYETIEDYAK